jgi:hypothetical protein
VKIIAAPKVAWYKIDAEELRRTLDQRSFGVLMLRALDYDKGPGAHHTRCLKTSWWRSGIVSALSEGSRIRLLFAIHK